MSIVKNSALSPWRRLRVLTLACLASVALPMVGSAMADVPQVAVSIKPIHSLVAAVMEGVGSPGLIVKGTGSEHGYALRPDDARMLANADIVFWIGPEMETFLQRPLETLATKAEIVELGEAPGVEHVPMREGGSFEAHTHDHDHDHDHAHSHDNDHDHSHDHDHAHTHDHGDHHDEEDLHIWLDPINAKAALAEIARTLAVTDPENADLYASNASAYEKRLDDLVGKITQELAPVRGRPFIVFHDAYHYFEKRFDIYAAGSITVSTAQAPSAQRVAEIRDKVRELKAACVFSEPQFESRLVATVIEGTDAKTGVLDPLGFDIEEGPDHYPQLIEKLASSLKACLDS